MSPPGGGGGAGGSSLVLRDLAVQLGPDFKVFFPVVLNMQLGGQVRDGVCDRRGR